MEIDLLKARSLARELTQEPWCCEEAKTAAEQWLRIEKPTPAETDSFIKELKEDVMTVEEVLNLCLSPEGEAAFGKEEAARSAREYAEKKAAGLTYCDCGACQKALAILTALGEKMDDPTHKQRENGK